MYKKLVLNNFLIHAIIIILFFSYCSKEKNETDENLTKIGTYNIDNTGGTISTDNFTLEIPEDAFSQKEEITLYKITENNTNFEIASDIYRIDNLPNNFSKPLLIKIKPQKNLPIESSFIGIGEKIWVKSLDKEQSSFNLYNVNDSSGYLITTLYPSQNNSNKIKKVSLSGGISLDFTVIAGITTYISEEKHFKLYFPTAYLDDAYNIGDILDNVYSKIKNWGFNYQGLTEPIPIYLKNLSDNIYGYSIYSMFSGGYIEININKINEEEELKVTLGHEFFHIVQTLYDNRNSFSKAKFKNPSLWVDEACAVWSEEFFSSNSNYISPVFINNADMIFKGANSINENDRDYGYGMAAFIKYITEQYGVSILPQIYNNIKNGKSSINSINMALSKQGNTSINLLWYKFIKKLISGEIYFNNNNFNASYFLGIAASNKFLISKDTDTLKEFDDNYGDLSTNLFLIQKHPNYTLKNNENMEFSLSKTSLFDLLLFKYDKSNSTCTFFNQLLSNSTLIISNINSILDNYAILGAVINNNLSYPYDNKNKNTLTIKRQTYNTTFEKAEFSIGDSHNGYYANSLWSFTSTDTSYEYYSFFNIYSTHPLLFNKQKDKEIIFVLDTTYSANDWTRTIHDTLSIKLDNIINPKTATNVYISHYDLHTYTSGEVTFKEENGIVVLKDLSITENSDNYQIKITGYTEPYVSKIESSHYGKWNNGYEEYEILTQPDLTGTIIDIKIYLKK